jgi:hypothetical protein
MFEPGRGGCEGRRAEGLRYSSPPRNIFTVFISGYAIWAGYSAYMGDMRNASKMPRNFRDTEVKRGIKW